LYKIYFTHSAEKEYKALYKSNPDIFRRVRNAILYISREPHAGKPLKLVLKGKWSYRVGPYRLIYSIEDSKLIIYILDIGHRRAVYRRRL
jgi:mRNA interferase RelE/StbE